MNGVLDAIPFEDVLEARFGDKIEKHLSGLVFDAAEASRPELARELTRAIRSNRFAAATVPLPFPEGGEVVVPTLDRTNPEAVRWIREHGAKLVREVSDETQRRLRNLVKRSFLRGIPPRKLARLIREEIGLTQRMGETVDRAVQKLADRGAGADVIERVRERMVNRLRRWRAMNIARTETIRASNMGQQFLWRKAADAGFLSRELTKRVWITTPDDRLCPFCAPMDGQEVGFEEGFQSGEVVTKNGTRQLPPTLVPPLHPMCRCAIGLKAVPGTRLAPTAAPPLAKPVTTPARLVFSEAKRLEDAVEYAEKTLGINRVNFKGRGVRTKKLGLEIANIINDGLTDLKNMGWRMPDELVVDAKEFARGSPTVAFMQPGGNFSDPGVTSKLAFKPSSILPESGSRLSIKEKLTLETKKIVGKSSIQDSAWWSGNENSDRIHLQTVYHEMTHSEHWLRFAEGKGPISKKDFGKETGSRKLFHWARLMRSWSGSTKVSTKEFTILDLLRRKNLDQHPGVLNRPEMAKAVSDYGSKRPTEFVAETAAGALTGKTYPDWVWTLYDALGGPNLPGVKR